MLSKRMFRNDLNTKSNNCLSVIVAFLMTFNGLLLALYPQSIFAFALLLACLVALNGRAPRLLGAHDWKNRATFRLVLAAGGDGNQLMPRNALRGGKS